jgi:glycogen debranching enzyme
VTLVDGTTFVVSGSSGAIGDAAVHGLYLFDTRAISRWRIDVRDWNVEPLSFVPDGPFAGVFVARADKARRPDAPVTLIQRRYVGRGMREDVEIRNHGTARRLTVRLSVATDLAGLFDVKEGRQRRRRAIRVTAGADGLRLRALPDAASTLDEVVVTSSERPDAIDEDSGTLLWHLTLDAGGLWSTCIEVSVVVGGRDVSPSHRCGEPVEEAIPVDRLRQWRNLTPQFESGDTVLDRMVTRAVDDLGALRIFDPEHAERVVVAAGAPWFMALFGRDSLLASWMALPFDQQLAAGVLAELADKQGSATDSRTEEQPGRILHEVRFDRASARLLGGSNIYYGTIDATPLFVMLVAELARWTGITDQIRSLMPAVDRAIDWIEQSGDRDGDGFVEYFRANPDGLEHQGWKDSWDGIRHADGTVAAAPVALCEVQGYVYAAYRARAALAIALGEGTATAGSFDARAEALRQHFDEAYWLDERGCYAVGLDADKQQIRSLTSNIGHLLWVGIVPEHRAARLAEHLVSPALNSGWGVRTLGTNEAGYNPLSYHCGSVWPHDTALAIAGLSRHGLDDASQRLARGLIDAASTSEGRLPELFGGFDRGDIGAPVPYPSSCSPQAWSSASPLLVVRAMLGLDPDLPAGRLRVRPRIPDAIGHLRLRGVRLGAERVDITADGEGIAVTGTDLVVEIG